MKRTAVAVVFCVLAAAGAAGPALAGTHEQVFEFIIKGNRHLEKKEIEKAIHEFTRAVDFIKTINEEHEFPLVYYNRARAFEAGGDFDSALKDYSKALALDPNYIMAYYNRGLLYQKTSRFELARADYSSMIERDTKQLHAYNNRGLVYTSQGEYEKALADFNRAIGLDEKAVNVHLNRGLAYLALGDYASARADFSYEQEKHPRSLGAPLLYQMVTAFSESKYAECRTLISRLEKMNYVLDRRFLAELEARAGKGGSQPAAGAASEARSAACGKLYQDIQTLIGAANYCDTDHDCVSADFGCSFGCASYVNRNEERKLRSYVDRYSRLACVSCGQPCPRIAPPVCAHKQCVARKCAVNREYAVGECECPEGTVIVQEMRNKKEVYSCVPALQN